MMVPKAWTKQPWESRILEIKCAKTLPENVSISNVSAAVFDRQGAEKTSDMIEGTPSIVGTNVYVQVKGGDDGADYSLRIRLTLSNGEKAEDDIIVYVRDAGL